jgi:hypothetical protein
VSTDHMDIPDHISLVGEAYELRGAIRAAADRGDVAETVRLIRRAHDLEIELFARQYADVRHARAQRGRLGGHNPQLEEVEAKLTEMLARLGVPSHKPRW